MNLHGGLGLLVVLSAAVFGTILLGQARLRPTVRSLVILGLWLRVGGSLGYLSVMNAYYGGGDYRLYFSEGQEYAELLTSGDVGAILDPWLQAGWWGTSFLIRVTGITLGVIGSTLPGAFIVFAMVGYVGILAFALAFHRAFPEIPVERYLVWIVLFPSLWFWPAALGKDALLLTGIGLAVLGAVGGRGRTGWLSLLAGTSLVFAIRPQVAAVLALALVSGHWVATSRRVTPVRVVQGVLLLGVGAGVLYLSSGALNVQLFQADEVGEYLESRGAASAVGGSAVGGEDGVSSPLMAAVTVLMRPFLWEARGVTLLVAALELTFVWLLAWRRRRHIASFVRANRRHRLFWVSVIFVCVYAVTLGMAAGNLGIIARQRVHILPFLFMLFAGPVARSGRPFAASRPPRSADGMVASV